MVDDGHGISGKDFHDRWLRIGSTHKQRERYSRDLERSLTGQKGVGRLAVQFLGRTLDLTTVAREDGIGLHANIDWDKALREKDLTEVEVYYEEISAVGLTFAGHSPHGVRLTIGSVRRSVLDDLAPRKLAEKLWALQPPGGVADDEHAFAVGVFDAAGLPVQAFDEALCRPICASGTPSCAEPQDGNPRQRGLRM